MPRIGLLAGTILACLCGASAAHAKQTFDNVIVFGDSLSDGGNLSSKLPPALVVTQPMRFTTNPGETAVEHVAQHYGFTLAPSVDGGTDYAWGGALAASDTSELGIPIPSTQHQLNDYFAGTGGRADPHALYTFWIGANDLFGALDANQSTAAAAATANAAAQAALNQLGQLRNAGARYIVVFNIPDLSKTPSYNTSPQLAEANAVTQAYNDALNAGLGKLGGIIPVNTYALISQVVADPARYGFLNVTDPACGRGSQSIVCSPAGTKGAIFTYAPGTNQTYLFADGVHPTTAAHALLAQVVLSELAAPQQISLLGEAPLAAATAQTAAARKQMLADTQGAGSRFFADVSYGRQRFDQSASSPRTVSNNVDLTVGGDWRINDVLSAGASLGVGHHDADFSGGGGYTMRDYSALAYLEYHAGGGYAGAYAITGRSRFSDIDRSFAVGPARLRESGDADGSHTGAGIHGGWWFGGAGVQTGPYANLEWQNISIEGFHEHGDDATAMWFGAQRRKALIGTLGWRLQGHWQVGSANLAPYAALAWNHDSKADPRVVTAGLNSMAGSFALAGYVPDKNWGSAEVGLGAQFSPRVSGWLGYNGRFSDASQRYSSLDVGLKIAL